MAGMIFDAWGKKVQQCDPEMGFAGLGPLILDPVPLRCYNLGGLQTLHLQKDKTTGLDTTNSLCYSDSTVTI